MKKFLITISVAISLLFGFNMFLNNTVKAEEIPETQNTETQENTEEPKQFEEIVYNFEDEGGKYVIALTSEEDFKLVATAEDTSSMTITGKYEIDEDGDITLTSAGKFLCYITENGKNLEFTEKSEELNENDEELKDYSKENLLELIKELTNELGKKDINYKQIGEILLAILGALSASILGLLIYAIRLKLRGLKNDEILANVEKKYNEKIDLFQKEYMDSLADLKKTVTKKIVDTEQEKEKAIEAQTIQLSKSVAEAKKNLSLDEILEEK